MPTRIRNLRASSSTATRRKDFEFERPALYSKQLRAIYAPERYSVIEASTKSGKTVGCMCWLAEQAWSGKSGHEYWWIAPIYEQARIVYRRLKNGLTRNTFTTNEKDASITLANGAVIRFKGADNPDSLYGEDVHAAVIDEATRCFVAGTPVDTPAGSRPIEQISAGDHVLNAVGTGRVRRVVRKQTSSVVALTVEGYTLVSSIDHRYLTRRGWIEAQHLEPTDVLITQSTAVRILRGDIHAQAAEAEPAVLLSAMPVRGSQSSRGGATVCELRRDVYAETLSAAETAVLRSVLLCEVENVAAGTSREGAHGGSAGEGDRRLAALVGAGHRANSRSSSIASGAQCDGQRGKPAEDGRLIASDWASAALARWQGSRTHLGAADALDRVRTWLGMRTGGAGQANSSWATEVSVRGRGSAVSAASDRGRWALASSGEDARGGSAQGTLPAAARVDRVEVLESGHPRFAVYSGGADTVDLYDLVVEGHPSFSVRGLLVHNCKEDAWFAVRSTLTATRGKVRIIGNVKGRRNWAYRLARRAEAGEPDMHYARITAYDAIQAGVLDQHEIDDARAQLPENVFRELYEAEPSDDEGNPFGINAIRACLEPLHGHCKPVVWGWDLARANDWTWGIALCEHARVCASERWNQAAYPTLDSDSDELESSHPQFWEVTLRRIRDLVGRTPAAVDSTGPGGPIDQALNGSLRNVEGVVFTAKSKQLLMEGLALAIQQREIGFPEGILQHELESFEYQYTRTGVKYGAPEGAHDDGVCALALAVYKFGQVPQLDMLKTLLTTPARIKLSGALVGGRQREFSEPNPLT